ncbi:tRNA pseudouridine synthase 1 [Dermatophagoides farinae]|uniref:tRNA pseudouridine synthase n=1 Tax=Dermatophagoides farinae TaxID=6954 RepID=A0A922IH22_DERFA|nr:tRNA pseudouridine synthase 1 [Dermatophagoides farinae]
MEFIVARIKGQSFMLHQIRKMIGLAISIMRGFVDQDVIKRSFSIDRIDIPMAPGLGLMLEEVHYEQYNKKYGGDGIHEPIVWDEFNDEIYDFKNKFIYPEIVATELNESSMLQWLNTLHIHTFDIRNHDERQKQRIRLNDLVNLGCIIVA